MKKLLFLIVAMVCVSFGQAYADYSFTFTNDQYGVTGILDTVSNGTGPLTVTGGTLTGTGSVNLNTSYSLQPAGLTLVNMDGIGTNLGPIQANLLYPGTDNFLPIGLIFVQTTNNPNGNLGMWIGGNGSNDYELFAGWGSADVHGTATLTPVATATPIPAAAWLFGSGLMGLVGIRKKLS